MRSEGILDPERAPDPCERWPELQGGEIKFRVHPEKGGIVFAIRGPLDARWSVVAIPAAGGLAIISALASEISRAMLHSSQQLSPAAGAAPAPAGGKPRLVT